MSSWKETLLGELYTRTLAFLRRGPDLLGAERAEIVARAAEARGAHAGRGGRTDGEPAPALAALFAGLPRPLLRRELGDAHRRPRAPDPRAARAEARARSSTCRTTRAWASPRWCWRRADTPGLLAEVAGVLYANRIEVVDAAIYSRQPADASEAAEALDVFRVRDSMGRPVTDEARWKKVREDLEAVLSGRIKAETLVAGRPAHANRSPPGDAGGPDRVQDRQRRQPRLHGRRGDHRGPARRPLRHRTRRCSSRASTSTARRSRPRPTAPSTSSTCATRRRW